MQTPTNLHLFSTTLIAAMSHRNKKKQQDEFIAQYREQERAEQEARVARIEEAGKRNLERIKRNQEIERREKTLPLWDRYISKLKRGAYTGDEEALIDVEIKAQERREEENKYAELQRRQNELDEANKKQQEQLEEIKRQMDLDYIYGSPGPRTWSYDR